MIGKQVGQYRLEQALGEGGFGTVYRGVHVHVGTNVDAPSKECLIC